MKRVNLGLFAQAEEKFQWWAVSKLPSWVTPDILTYLAFLAFFSTGPVYFLAGQKLSFLWLASLCVFLHWLFDGVDGKLAKFRQQSRPKYGFYLDHLLDSIGTFSLFLGMFFSDLTVSFWPLVGMSLIALLLINTYLLHSVTQTLYLAYGRIGGTEAGFFLIILNALCFFLGNPSAGALGLRFNFFDWICFALSLIALIILVKSFLDNIKRLRKEKPRR